MCRAKDPSSRVLGMHAVLCKGRGTAEWARPRCRAGGWVTRWATGAIQPSRPGLALATVAVNEGKRRGQGADAVLGGRERWTAEWAEPRCRVGGGVPRWATDAIQPSRPGLALATVAGVDGWKITEPAGSARA